MALKQVAKGTKTKIHKVVLMDIDKIHVSSWNPNFVSGHIKSAIKDDIAQNGFIDPIVVQKHNKKLNKDFVIINGEHRFDIMKDRGADQITAIVLDVDDKTAKALTIRLNREHGELFPDKMSTLLKDLSPKLDFGYLKKITFLDQDEVLSFAEINVDDITKHQSRVKNTRNIFTKEVVCPNCQNKFILQT